MEVGDYVKTDTGYIAKISNFIEHYTKGKGIIDYLNKGE